MKLSFEKAAHRYHQHSTIQKNMALRLCNDLFSHSLQFAQALEFGCGTGHLSQILARSQTIQSLVISDISPAMLQQNILWASSHFNHLNFEIIDIQNHEINPALELLISNATVQWLDDLPKLLDKAYQNLPSGAVTAFSFFGPQNLSEIYSSYAQSTGSVFPIPIQLWNPLELQQICIKFGWQVLNLAHYQQIQSGDSLLDLLHNFKKTGVSPNRQRKALSKIELRNWCNHYQDCYPHEHGVYCTWDCAHLILQKNN